MGELLDVTDNLFEGSSSGLAVGIDNVQVTMENGVRLGGGGEGAGVEEQGDAVGVKGVDILRLVMSQG